MTEDKLKSMLYKMIKIRYAESKVAELFLAGEIPGFLHSYVGQEAVAVGACEALRGNDYITSTHRGHGHLIAKGGRMDGMFAELFGKKTGYCKGKGGSMHIADVSIGILGANGIVGAGLPIANGAALTSKMKNTGQVTLCFFGDGAANQGTFHESLNLASVWKLPVVFICENNLYAMSTPCCEHMNISNICERAKAYGIPGSTIDGNNVAEVYEEVSKAVERARSGDGPALIECKCFRKFGHFVGDPGDYRSKEQVEEWEKRDCIIGLKENLIKSKIFNEKEILHIENEVKREIDEAVNFAKESSYPSPADAMEDVYSDWNWGEEYR